MVNEIRVSVPGSIMLMGEHAVLHGELALACAVDKYLYVTLTPRTDQTVIVDSALAHYQGSLHDLQHEPKLGFVLAAIDALKAHLSNGFSLCVRSEFAHTLGLGSSAAVSVGVVAALSAYAQLDTSPAALFDRALGIVHKVQDGRGSGTDLAASVYGSVVAFRVSPRSVETLPFDSDLCLYYSGYKTKTVDVLKIVEQLSRSDPGIHAALYRLMGQVTAQAKIAIGQHDMQRLGVLMNTYQGLMDALGVSDHTLCDIVYRLRNSPDILGAKISGSGLGDCVLGLGAQSVAGLGYESIPVAISPKGVHFGH
ncbi:MAG: mevalonate kinase [Gammaproteobacteria bacterium]|nr:MAG: mevalonate kinase [Pseudomonadota bacterium]PIE38856.1 MAG: mevalonate kinase [Gammaproteobacteria bacterium]